MTTLRSMILKLDPGRAMKKILLILALFVPITAFGQGSPVTGGLPSWFAGPTGAPKAGAIIHICAHPANAVPCTNYASVYSDIGLTVLINQATNPITTDGLGNVPTVYIAPGTYDATLSGAGISSPNGPYVFGISCIAGSSCATLTGSNNFTGPNSFSQPITSTVATGTAPLAIASTTVIPNLNAQLHNGLTAPASAIVGISDIQALINKTFDISANTLKNSSNTAGHVPRNNGTQYADAQLGFSDLSGTASTSQIGTGTPAAGRYVDGSSGAWTALPSGGFSVAQADLTAQQANVGPNTLTTPGADGFYRINCFVILTRAATTSSTLPQCSTAYASADTSGAETPTITTGSAANTVGTVGALSTGLPNYFYAKSGTAITYTTFNYASSGATQMQYAVHVRLEGPF